MLTLTDAAPNPATLIPFSFEGETRVKDVDLGARLGFGQPRDIRKIIARHRAALLPNPFSCRCGETFNIQVWHCPVCDHHWPMDRETCWNCHEGRRPAEVTGA